MSIEEQIAELRKQASQSEWKKMSSDIPFHKVLIYNGNTHFGWLRTIEIDKFGCKYIFDSNGDEVITDATHWMLIPKI